MTQGPAPSYTLSMTKTQTTRNGHTVTLRTLDNGSTEVRSAGFVNSYASAEFAAHVANIVFMWKSTGCYACGVEAATTKRPHLATLDTSPHTH